MPASRILSRDEFRPLLLPLLLSGLSAAAAAHEGEHGLVPTLHFGVGLQAVTADHPWPAPRLPGVLEAGSPREDEREGRLGYLELGLELPLPGDHQGELRFSKHGESVKPEVESAWVQGEAVLGAHLARYRLGRQLAPAGLENQVDSHHRDFGVAPIALRGVLNDAWRADGLRLDMALPGGWDAGVGIWRNDGFPGAPSGKPDVFSARLGWSQGEWLLESGYIHADVDGRGLMTTGTAGHTHSLPSCGVVDANRVCYSGATHVAHLALQWRPEDRPWWLGGEWLFKRDKGNLDSVFGLPDYQGDFNGGWLDLGWTFSPSLEARFRLERAIASHELAGVNATLVANQAGIANSDRALRSLGAALSWRPAANHYIGVEWHGESIQARSDQVFMLRYQYHFGMPLQRGR